MAQPDICSTDEIVVTFAGIPIVGFALSSFFKVTFDNDLVTFSPGADGKGTYVMNNQRSAKVEFMLRRNAPANIALGAKLTALLGKSYAAAGGPFFARNTRTKTIYSCPLAYIVKAPDYEQTNDAGNTSWMITCGEMSVVVGGIAQ